MMIQNKCLACVVILLASSMAAAQDESGAEASAGTAAGASGAESQAATPAASSSAGAPLAPAATDIDAYEDIADVPLDALLNMEISLATKKAVTKRETPAIVTIITEEEIKRSGARDMIDILELVPGFTFGVDVMGVVGVGVRGNWAHEGKVLLLVDGQEMQELLFSTLQFGSHFPVHNIKKIEIIRGPGSAIYGGNAELAVINVITKNAKDVNGVSIVATAGQHPRKLDTSRYYHRSMNISAGKSVGDLDFVVHGTMTVGKRSDRMFHDFYGDSYNMSVGNTVSAGFLNAGVSHGDLSVRFIYDRYHTQQQDAYFANLTEPSLMNFDSYFGEARYDLKVSDKLTISPKVNLKVQYPWNASTDEVWTADQDPSGSWAGLYDNKRLDRYTVNLTALYDVYDQLSLVAGAEYFIDRGIALDDKALFAHDKRKVSFWNAAGFVQGMLQTEWVDVTAGGRFDYREEAGYSFVPRLGLTRAFEQLHVKALLSRAFRTPGIANFDNFNPEFSGQASIKPETSTIAELEVGYKLTDNLAATGNLYYIRISDPIVYFYIDDDAYDNFEKTGTFGGEVELRYKARRGYGIVSYSYYEAYDNAVDQYEVPKMGQVKVGNYGVQSKYMLGFPRHKATFYGSLVLWKGLSLNPSLVYMSKKFGYEAADADDNLVIGEFAPVVLFNLSLQYKDLVVDGLRVALSGYNLFGEKNYFVQPYYDGYHAPMPGPSLEVLLTVGYEAKF